MPPPELAAGPDDGVLSPLPDELPDDEPPDDEPLAEELPEDDLPDDELAADRLAAERCVAAEPELAAAAEVPPGRLAARLAAAMMLAAVAPAATVRIRASPRSLAAGVTAGPVWFLFMLASLAGSGQLVLSNSSAPAMSAVPPAAGRPENQMLTAGPVGTLGDHACLAR